MNPVAVRAQVVPRPAAAPRWPALVGLAVLVALSRLPFLGVGYGSDMDAWSVAYATRWIAEHGQYGASRFPGHPVQELTMALLWRGGPWALNGATAAMSAGAAAAFAALLGTLRVRDAWLGGLALASTPVIFIHSTDAMDFVWALTFLVMSLLGALRGRAVMAGVMLGLAIGCRITSAAMAPTVALLLLARAADRGDGVRQVMASGLAALVAGAIALAPMIARFGLSFFTFYDSPRRGSILDIAKNGTLEVWGALGTLALVAVTALALARRRSVPAMPRLELAAWLAALALYGVAFMRLPFDAGYLVPVVPVILVLGARLLERRGQTALWIALVVAPWVLEVAEVGRSDSPRPSPLARIVRIQGRPVAIDPLQGPILWDHARRTAQLLHRDRILAATDALGPGVMVITDGWTSWLQVDHRAAAPPGARFVHALTAERAAELRRRGVEIFYLPEAQWNYEAVHGVGLESLGASPLPGLSTRTGVGR